MPKNAKFTFHPVGQGLFYSGKIMLLPYRGYEFNFVYDCGSDSGESFLNDSIDNYRDYLNNDIIDVLFISHLDRDHVNGIKYLIKEKKVKRIYLPYLTPCERLFVAIRQRKRDIVNDQEYLEFLKSPHNYIHNLNENISIIYINGNSEKEIENNNFANENEFTDNLEVGERPNSEDFNNNEIFKKGNGKLFYKNIWEFYLYHESIGKGNKVFNDKYKNLTKEELIKILDKKGDTFETLYKSKTEKRNKFNFNKESLVVLHKPITYKTGQLFKHYNDYFIPHYFNRHYCKYCYSKAFRFNEKNKPKNSWGATLLTGDIGLNQIENSLYIKSQLENVLVFHVPHHGSKTNWKEQYLDLLNYKGRTIAILSFGYGNTHGHPHHIVLNDLDKENFDIVFCNQFERFDYLIRVDF